MQAKELRRDQAFPELATETRPSKTYFMSKSNSLIAQGQHDWGQRNDVQNRRRIGSVPGTRSNTPPPPIIPTSAPQHTRHQEEPQTHSEEIRFNDYMFFREEVYFFLIPKRTPLTSYCRKMIRIVDFYLSERDIETVSYLAAGYGAKEIAREFNLSPRTVEHRIETLKRRLGARNVTHLIAMVLLAKNLGTADVDPRIT